MLRPVSEERTIEFVDLHCQAQAQQKLIKWHQVTGHLTGLEFAAGLILGHVVLLEQGSCILISVQNAIYMHENMP